MVIICAWICVGICAGMNGNVFVGAGMCICAWLVVKDLGILDAWIVIFAFMVSLAWYDMWGVQFIMLLCVALIFNIIRTYLARSNSDSSIWLLCAALFTALCADVIVKILMTQYVAYETNTLFMSTVISVFTFWIFLWFVEKCERFVDLYAHDVQGHR